MAAFMCQFLLYKRRESELLVNTVSLGVVVTINVDNQVRFVRVKWLGFLEGPNGITVNTLQYLSRGRRFES